MDLYCPECDSEEIDQNKHGEPVCEDCGHVFVDEWSGEAADYDPEIDGLT